jgi:hypothetical protein
MLCSAVIAVKCKNESGNTHDNQLQDACAPYVVENKVPFTMILLWLVSHLTQKWRDTVIRLKGRLGDTASSASTITPSGRSNEEREKLNEGDHPIEK